ncbi:MAG: hypothetical protein CSB55_06405 [Candidatus Cloacimonadota bacterium]|nr:MAG: hypothetical protein CSB55_06405 [Candidatus Cloacimonadota bacterium]
MKKIKMLIMDCDGVLTDGKISYDNNETERKNFSAKDGLGIMILHQAGIIPAIITGRTSRALQKRCNDLKIEHLHQGVKNKIKYASELLESLGIEWEETAYIGDDWNDFPVIEKCGFSACPADAFGDFKEHCDFVTSRKGGDGAVREFIEEILKSAGIYEETKQKFIAYLKSH